MLLSLLSGNLKTKTKAKETRKTKNIEKRRKPSFIKRIGGNTGLYKPVSNKIMTVRE